MGLDFQSINPTFFLLIRRFLVIQQGHPILNYTECRVRWQRTLRTLFLANRFIPAFYYSLLVNMTFMV